MNVRNAIIPGIFFAVVAAGAQSATHTQVAGTILAVRPAANHFILKTDKGETVDVATTDRTVIIHVPPGETDIRKGTKMPFSSLGAGDRVVAFLRGETASSLVVRTKADIEEIQKKELEDWAKRGTLGRVTAVDAAAKTATVAAAGKTYTVQTSEQTQYHRYSPDSANPADARASNFAEIQVGDQMHVLGDKSEDGTTIKAESIYTGMFRQFNAQIISIDAAKGELTVKDLATKKPMVILINADSTMRKVPEMLAQGLARRYGHGGAGGSGIRGRRSGGGAGGPAAGGPAADGPAAGGSGGPGGPGRGGNMDLASILGHLPAMPLSELKPGDAIMVSTTAGSDPSRVTAIMLLAGVEPIITAAPESTRDIFAGWGLGGNGGGGGDQ